jgi:hypothetical protein
MMQIVVVTTSPQNVAGIPFAFSMLLAIPTMV